ncbi:paired amphipathic helix protein Sin3-like 2 [Olea europaea var. sylvestris]|uniref:paired amphipathic helix protein Sin3-like 2 n=1 Tax=Olea europaea var. sylvestris TaxID=158386 RepID=UPI000C1CD88D|nr:paired amphipathic helix protein Sin3-like 2 [Olea europaea var. sylvestris]
MAFKPNFDNALSFVDIVKQRFHDQESIYQEFRYLCERFRREFTEPESVISQVKNLFSGHPDLISQFLNFVPKILRRDKDTAAASASASTTSRNSSDEVGREKTKSCIEFVNWVAETLQDDYKFKSFLDAVNGFRKYKDIDRVRERVSVIFKDHPELDIEFSRFLLDAVLQQITECEEVLFDCEEKMYEFDMKYHSLKSNMEAVDQMAEELKRNQNESTSIEDYLATVKSRLNKKYMKLNKDRERSKIKCARNTKETHEKINNHMVSVKKASASASAKRSSPESTLKVEDNKENTSSENKANPRSDLEQVHRVKRVRIKYSMG